MLRPLGVLLVSAAGASALLAWPAVPDAARALGGNDFPSALLGLGVIAWSLLAAWILLITAARMARISLPGVPRALRVVMFTGVVVAVGSAPAHADTGRDLDGLPLPDRPVVGAPQTPQPIVPVAEEVTVQSGDTLWSLAAASLPRDASSSDVAASTRAWHANNRAVIGDDPNLIRPGQQLTAPVSRGEDHS